MNCADAAELINDYMSRELSALKIAELEKHLHLCQPCQGHFAYDQALKALLKNKMVLEQLSPNARTLLEKTLNELAGEKNES